MVRTLASKNKIFSIRKVKNQKKWNKEEDKLLIQLAQKYNEKNWKEISSKFNNKNPLQCFSRYKRIRPGIKKGTWKKEEDEQIIKLVKKYGNAWSKISREIKTRNGKQIRDRYLNVLDPSVNKDKFTYSEDVYLLKLFNKHGPKWAVIARYFPLRTADMIKNRFHSSIKKRVVDNGLGLSPNPNDSSPLSTEIKSISEHSHSIHNNEDIENLSLSSLSLPVENIDKKEIVTNNLFDTKFFDFNYIEESISNFELFSDTNTNNTLMMSEDDYLII